MWKPFCSSLIKPHQQWLLQSVFSIPAVFSVKVECLCLRAVVRMLLKNVEMALTEGFALKSPTLNTAQCSRCILVFGSISGQRLCYRIWPRWCAVIKANDFIDAVKVTTLWVLQFPPSIPQVWGLTGGCRVSHERCLEHRTTGPSRSCARCGRGRWPPTDAGEGEGRSAAPDRSQSGSPVDTPPTGQSGDYNILHTLHTHTQNIQSSPSNTPPTGHSGITTY